MSFLCFKRSQGLFRQWSGPTSVDISFLVTARYCRTRTGVRPFSESAPATNDLDRWIKTLTPLLFHETKQEVLDVSELTNPTLLINSPKGTYKVPISYNPRKVPIMYDKKQRKEENVKGKVSLAPLPLPEETHEPFPPNTRGLFYYQASANLHPMTDSIRFRLCDAPSNFHLGTDLLLPSGIPWTLPLWRITWHKDMEGLRHLIKKETLVSTTFLENNDVLEELNRTKNELNPLFSLRQPFLLDVNRWAHKIQLVTRHGITTFRLNQLFNDSVVRTQPYQGHIRVQFELVISPARKKTLQMRILEHVTEVSSRIPKYPGKSGRIPCLEPGTLISKRSKYGAVTKPWTYSLDSRKYGLVWKRFLKFSP